MYANYIRSLSDKTEFFIVILVAFGWFLYLNFTGLFVETIPDYQDTESSLYFLVFYEIVVFIVLIPFLFIRGMRTHNLSKKPRLLDLPIGLLLFFGIYLFYYLAWFLMKPYIALENNLDFEPLSILSVVLISFINPFFEEIFVCAFVIASLKRTMNINLSIGISVLIRICYHLYQGSVGIVFNLIAGSIAAIYYAKTHRLAPIIILHIAFDLLGLWVYVAN